MRNGGIAEVTATQGQEYARERLTQRWFSTERSRVKGMRESYSLRPRPTISPRALIPALLSACVTTIGDGDDKGTQG